MHAHVCVWSTRYAIFVIYLLNGDMVDNVQPPWMYVCVFLLQAKHQSQPLLWYAGSPQEESSEDKCSSPSPLQKLKLTVVTRISF